MCFGQCQFIGDGGDVALVDEGRKFLRKRLFLGVHIAEGGLIDAQYEIFAQHALCILQVVAYGLAPSGFQFGCPNENLFYIQRPRQAHHACEPVEMALLLAALFGQFAQPRPTALRHARQQLQVVGRQVVACLGGVYQIGLVEWRHRHTLHTRQNGADNFVGFVGNEQKKCVFGRLFDNFQQVIGASFVQFFGVPHQHHLVFRFVGFQIQFADYLIALGGIDEPFFVLADTRQPLVERGVRVGSHHLAKFGQIVVTKRAAIGLHNGKNQVQIGVRQLGKLYARRTLPTRIGGGAVFAANILRIGQRQRQFASPFDTAQQLRMRNTPLAHRLPQAFFHIFVSYDIGKKHFRTQTSTCKGTKKV